MSAAQYQQDLGDKKLTIVLYHKSLALLANTLPRAFRIMHKKRLPFQVAFLLYENQFKHVRLVCIDILI